MRLVERVIGQAAQAPSGDSLAPTLRALNAEYIRLHPDEVATFLDGLPVLEAAGLVGLVSAAAAASLIERLNPRVAAEILSAVGDEFVRPTLAALDAARVAPIVASLDPAGRERTLALLEPARADTVRELLTYPADTAGALMDPRITAFGADTNVEEALRRMRTFKEKELGAIYLTGADGRLAGTVPLGELATAAPEVLLRELVRGGAAAVPLTATREEVVHYLNEHRASTLPVVDGGGRLVGVIRYRALMAATEAEATAGFQTMVGVSRDERALSPVPFSVRHRLPWLQINLLTAFLAAFVVGIFEGTIARVTALAVLLPVVAGQSGNSGMQALAVTMRGLALREVRVAHWPRLVLKEAGVGLVNGLAIAGTTMLGVFLWSRSLGLTAVIGIAMVVAMVIAGISGAAIPLLLKASGQDPAQSSSIVLTTVTDVVGFLTFLGLATLFSGLL